MGKVQFGAITRQVALGFVPEAAISRVEVLPCHQLTAELAEPASIADTVLFIDCARDPLRRIAAPIGLSLIDARSHSLGVAGADFGTLWRLAEGLSAIDPRGVL